MAQRNFTVNNDQFVQASNGAGVSGDRFEFFGGNDRLFLFRNDDFSGLGPTGVADMGAGDDTVVTSFNASGSFLLGSGNDLFVSDGDVSFGSARIGVDAGAGNDVIAVTTNESRYFGGLDNDVFLSDPRDNFFDGGDGIDTYSAELAGQRAFINMQTREAFSFFVSRSDQFLNVENVRGSAFDDEILGNNGDNRLDGLAGNDIIDGAGGNDVIAGGTGRDSLFGGANIDTLVLDGVITSKGGTAGQFNVQGSSGGQTFQVSANGFEQVLLNGTLMSAARFLDPAASNLISAGIIETADVLGSISGRINGIVVNGSERTETLNGNIGDDDITGFAGNDTLNGLNGNDRIDGGADNDSIVASNGNDLLIGGSGNDTLLGGQGVDTLNGGTGKDLFTGGGGLDRFIFSALTDTGVTFATRDVINTFAHGDKIDLSAIDARTNQVDDQAFTFIGAAAFSGSAGQLRFDMTNISETGVKAYTVQGDINGDRVADLSLQIFTSPTADRPGQVETFNIFAFDFIL